MKSICVTIGKRFVWVVAVCCVVLCGRAEALPLAPETLTQFFLMPDRPGKLCWKTEIKDGTVKYRLSGYDGNVVTAGEARIRDGKIMVPVRLPRGYYEITFPEQKVVFGLVSMEPHQGAVDRFFGIDAVLNWLDRRDWVRQELVRILKYAGVGMARERISWGGINPKPGAWNWKFHDRTRELRQMYERAGIPVLEMFHDPGPARGVPSMKMRYPQNLQQVVRSWPEIRRNLAGAWGGLEVWNEPEGLYGSGLPADQYLPVVKAMRYTMQQNSITAPLGGGVFMGLDPSEFHRFCVLNGLLDMVDFISFHDYQPTVSLERVIAVHRQWLRRSGHPAMPLWLTECGFSWSIGPGRPPMKEDMRSAVEIIGKAVEAKACGIFSYMPFCLAFYEEGGVKSFSMMGREVTPLRSMAAYVQGIRVLSGRNYVGDLTCENPALLRRRVFSGPEGDLLVAVLYTGKTVSDEAATLPVKILRAEGIDGRPLLVKNGKTLQIVDGLVYVWLARSDVARFLRKDTAAAQLLHDSRQVLPPAGTVGPVVLQHLLTPGQLSYSCLRYLVSQEKAGKLMIVIRVHNLSRQNQTMTLWLKWPGKTEQDRRSVTVASEGTKEVEWTVDASAYLSSTAVTPLTVGGQYADGVAVSPVAIPLQREGSLAELRRQCLSQTVLPFTELKRWEKNIASHGRSEMSVRNGNWFMEVDFKKSGDRWTYPKLKVDGVDFRGMSGLLLRCRAQNRAQVRLMLWNHYGGGFWTSNEIMPVDGQWHVVYVPFRDFEPLPSHPGKKIGPLDPAEIAFVSVGMHDGSEKLHNILEISDLLVVKCSGEGE